MNNSEKILMFQTYMDRYAAKYQANPNCEAWSRVRNGGPRMRIIHCIFRTEIKLKLVWVEEFSVTFPFLTHLVLCSVLHFKLYNISDIENVQVYYKKQYIHHHIRNLLRVEPRFLLSVASTKFVQMI